MPEKSKDLGLGETSLCRRERQGTIATVNVGEMEERPASP